MDLELARGNAIITLASRGMGRSIALVLANEDGNVAIGVLGEEALQATKEELLEKGVKVHAESCDIVDTNRFNTFLETVKSQFGTAAILASNASALSLGKEYTDWEALTHIDLLARVKAALIRYSKTLSAQLSRKNIRVNTIAPCSVQFSDGLWEMIKKQDNPFYDQIVNTLPSGRMGRPDEIGKVAAFLVSPFAS